MPEWLWDAAETVTTSDNSRILAIGNPDNPGSHFAKVCSPGWPGWARHKISVFDSPNFTGEDVPPHVARKLAPGDRGSGRTRLPAGGVGRGSPITSTFRRSSASSRPTTRGRSCRWRTCSPASSPTCSRRTGWCRWSSAWMWAAAVTGRWSGSAAGCKAGRQWKRSGPATLRPEEIGRLVLRCIRETGATSVKVDSIGVGAGVVWRTDPGTWRCAASEHSGMRRCMAWATSARRVVE